MLFFKIFMVLLLLLVITNLALSLRHLVHGTKGVTKFLQSRLLISLALVVFLISAYALGWLTLNPSPLYDSSQHIDKHK